MLLLAQSCTQTDSYMNDIQWTYRDTEIHTVSIATQYPDTHGRGSHELCFFSSFDDSMIIFCHSIILWPSRPLQLECWNAFSNWTASFWRPPGRWLRQRRAISRDKVRLRVSSMTADSYQFSSWSYEIFWYFLQFFSSFSFSLLFCLICNPQEKDAPASCFQRCAVRYFDRHLGISQRVSVVSWPALLRT